jgi:hypothetical protein
MACPDAVEDVNIFRCCRCQVSSTDSSVTQSISLQNILPPQLFTMKLENTLFLGTVAANYMTCLSAPWFNYGRHCGQFWVRNLDRRSAYFPHALFLHFKLCLRWEYHVSTLVRIPPLRSAALCRPSLPSTSSPGNKMDIPPNGRSHLIPSR